MGRPRATSDEQILAATERAIGALGLPKLTLAVVAGEAGVSPATLVQRFGSKRGLLLAFAAQAAGGLDEAFATVRREHASPLEALHAVLGELSAGMRTREEIANHLGALQLDLTDPEFHAHAATHAHRMDELLAGLLADAVAAGELRPGTEVARLARTVQVVHNGTLVMWAITGGEDLPARLRGELDDLLDNHRMG
ncbi:TetR/AcrR family transcriptional regulator [Phytomonospora endophytica]|uniref:AcrR family transcriptional regulator n=1 Tax=Phytomonospora endophytica TaxID=714109 RepID=A0A841F878_9ACTN|nr:TetR/AcrR family transcriptional regulator [Phytomonospora endophytica]MBB6032426.1 AcrR family transcriptional regulator [Phytomonospora endophytica]GIG66427.1 TetR family transcriptional regulator [Phytomonospora endophytica]